VRPEGKLALGYFPLPDAEASNLAKMLAIPEGKPITALDPCAGTGKTLLDITQASSSCTRYAVEIDARRARECASNGITTLHSRRRLRNHVDGVLQPSLRHRCSYFPHRGRLESVFLDSITEWLAPGGLLVFVVPHYTLNSCITRSSTAYENIRIYRLSAPDSLLYKQVVVFAVRKKISQYKDYAIDALVQSIRQIVCGR